MQLDPPWALPIKTVRREREFLLTDKQLFGEDCHEAISFLKHATDRSVMKEKMRAMFQYRLSLVQDQPRSSPVLDCVPKIP